jgi:hypothetical protein
MYLVGHKRHTGMRQSELSDDENLFSGLRPGRRRETDQHEHRHDKPTQCRPLKETNSKREPLAQTHVLPVA